MLGTDSRTALTALVQHSRRGFTLIEIAIVLVVIGLLISGGLLAVGPVIQSAKISETKQKMATVEAALLGYVIANGCLPCPAARGASATGITNNGTADYTTACGSGGACTGAGNGLVPWVTLGIAENDAIDGWGRRLIYSVDPTLTNASNDVQRNSDGSFPTFTSTLGMENLAGDTLGYNAIAYVLVSHGSDGSFGETVDGTTGADKYGQAAGATGLGQHENGNGDINFATGQTNSTNSTAYFDDIVSFKSFQPLILSCGAGSCGNPS